VSELDRIAELEAEIKKLKFELAQSQVNFKQRGIMISDLIKEKEVWKQKYLNIIYNPERREAERKRRAEEKEKERLKRKAEREAEKKEKQRQKDEEMRKKAFIKSMDKIAREEMMETIREG
jgi:hypothetical protein